MQLEKNTSKLGVEYLMLHVYCISTIFKKTDLNKTETSILSEKNFKYAILSLTVLRKRLILIIPSFFGVSMFEARSQRF